jgi:nitrate reductase gamma subunit
MNVSNLLGFLVFPYLALTTFVVGHIYRYRTDALSWNSKSSELLDRESLKYGITIFHWGILLTLFGHAGGLLIPQRVYDAVGIDGQAHTRLAIYSGMVAGLAALAGSLMLLRRGIGRKRIRATTSLNDFITLAGLIFVIAAGLYNVFFGHYYVLDTIAPWIRSIITLTPKPELMVGVPLSYKIHILAALGLLGFSPFSRLVHIWSVPLSYLIRSYIVFRKHEERAF